MTLEEYVDKMEKEFHEKRKPWGFDWTEMKRDVKILGLRLSFYASYKPPEEPINLDRLVQVLNMSIKEAQELKKQGIKKCVLRALTAASTGICVIVGKREMVDKNQIVDIWNYAEKLMEKRGLDWIQVAVASDGGFTENAVKYVEDFAKLWKGYVLVNTKTNKVYSSMKLESKAAAEFFFKP